ncbi:hypothetical protein VN97_g6092 [Penicillium thymicola]|uniref:Uncharacterized protein n=1 Tax=Penicillium thymicola TaxID=293382 RepID=A0AAI9THJ0_PENTH|nr:hypothetical protein VN97_g6092 [Penicillium thymicola]
MEIQSQAQNSVYILFGYLRLVISCSYQLAPSVLGIHNLVSIKSLTFIWDAEIPRYQLEKSIPFAHPT